jgi:hypothetical protein
MKAAISMARLTGRSRGQLALDDVGFGGGKRVAP